MSGTGPRLKELEALISETLPRRIVVDSSPYPDLASTLRNVHIGKLEFGRRLILTGGLVAAAMYSARVNAAEEARDHRLDDHVRALLSKPYSLGMAVSILSRAETLEGVLGFRFGHSTEVLSTFASLFRGSPKAMAITLRSLSLTTTLGSVVECLAFLRSLEFDDDGRTLRFDGTALDAWPFLWWEEDRLWTLRDAQRPISKSEASVPTSLSFASHEDLEEQERDFEPGSMQIHTLRRLLQRHGVNLEEVLSSDVMQTESFVPLFVDSHRQIDKLVDLLVEKSNDDTKQVWLKWFLGISDDREIDLKQRGILENPDKILLENAILAYCVANDPVSVLTEFFYKEKDDIEGCISKWRPKDESGNDVLARIDARASTARTRAAVFAQDDAIALDYMEGRERARLAALEMARALGFTVRESLVRDDVETLIARFSPFLAAIQDDPSADRLLRGLVECARMLERILTFTVSFYRLIPDFVENSSTGLVKLSPREYSRRLTLGPLFEEFRSICTGLQKGRPELGFRKRRIDGTKKHFATLERFVNLRNRDIHPPSIESEMVTLNASQRLELLHKVLEFFEWLGKPGQEASELGRITPAVLHLNLVTTNRCGITTVHYKLSHRVGEGSPKEITLYTAQPVAGAPGVFYGLPRPDKCMTFGGTGTRHTGRRGALWVDPILFAADAFDSWTGANPAEGADS